MSNTAQLQNLPQWLNVISFPVRCGKLDPGLPVSLSLIALLAFGLEMCLAWIIWVEPFLVRNALNLVSHPKTLRFVSTRAAQTGSALPGLTARCLASLSTAHLYIKPVRFHVIIQIDFQS